MYTYNRLNEKFTEIIASNLHFQDFYDSDSTAEEMLYASNGAMDRYRFNPKFHARVDSIVASLSMVAADAIDSEIEFRGEIE